MFDPGLGRSPGKGNGYPLPYSCLENPWIKEPGRLQSIGSQRVRHGWATNRFGTGHRFSLPLARGSLVSYIWKHKRSGQPGSLKFPNTLWWYKQFWTSTALGGCLPVCKRSLMPRRKGTGFKSRRTWVSTFHSCVSLPRASVSSSVLRGHHLYPAQLGWKLIQWHVQGLRPTRI